MICTIHLHNTMRYRLWEWTGYWVNYQTPDTFTISGFLTGPLTITTSQSGWVLLGSRATPFQVSSLQLSNGALIVGFVYRYNTVRKCYEVTRTINPGEAYWLNVSKACTITLP